jgi:hypothetical protein
MVERFRGEGVEKARQFATLGKQLQALLPKKPGGWAGLAWPQESTKACTRSPPLSNSEGIHTGSSAPSWRLPCRSYPGSTWSSWRKCAGRARLPSVQTAAVPTGSTGGRRQGNGGSAPSAGPPPSPSASTCGTSGPGGRGPRQNDYALPAHVWQGTARSPAYPLPYPFPVHSRRSLSRARRRAPVGRVLVRSNHVYQNCTKIRAKKRPPGVTREAENPSLC